MAYCDITSNVILFVCVYVGVGCKFDTDVCECDIMWWQFNKIQDGRKVCTGFSLCDMAYEWFTCWSSL